MKMCKSLPVACLAVLISFASLARADEPNVQEKMVGKWEATTGPIKGAIFDFAKDGVLKLAVKVGDSTMNLEGKYKVASAEIVEFTFMGKTDKVKYKFEKEILILTDPEGNPIKCTKLK